MTRQTFYLQEYGTTRFSVHATPEQFQPLMLICRAFLEGTFSLPHDASLRIHVSKTRCDFPKAVPLTYLLTKGYFLHTEHERFPIGRIHRLFILSLFPKGRFYMALEVLPKEPLHRVEQGIRGAVWAPTQ